MDGRSLLRCSRGLAKIGLLQGRYETVVSTILSCREEMQVTGDGIELSSQTQLLISAYLKLDELVEAKDICMLTMQLLQDMTVRWIEKKLITAVPTSSSSSAPGTANTRTSSAASSTSRVVVASSSSSSLNPKQQQQQQQHERVAERSYANLQSIFEMLQSYAAVTLVEVRQLLGDGVVDPRPLFTVYSDKIATIRDLIIDISGDVSPLHADIITLKVTSTLEFIHIIHSTRSSYLLQPIETYYNWIVDQFSLCVHDMKRVIDIQKQLLQYIPTDDYQYYSERIDMTMKESSTGSVCVLPYQPIAVPSLTRLTNSQILLASIFINYGMYKHQHISPMIDIIPIDSLNSVDRFLEETKPSYEYKLDDFITPLFPQASQLLNDVHRIVTTSFDIHIEVEVMRLTALVMYFQGIGELIYVKYMSIIIVMIIQSSMLSSSSSSLSSSLSSSSLSSPPS